MRFLHTADWHLGKIVNDYNLIEDQRYILNQILTIAKENQVDAIVMAGDVYDRSLPSKEAVALLNETISKIHHELQIPFLAIAGNHDSPQRIEYASSLLKDSDVYFAGELPVRKVSIKETDFFLFPFADHQAVKHFLKNDDISNLEEATKELIDHCELDESRINVALYHGYVVEGTTSLLEADSERPLSIGTTSYVNGQLFSLFDYVALGHLHKPQVFTQMAYSGSILKYSKSEAKGSKNVFIVEVDKQNIEIQKIELKPQRDLRVIKGSFNEVIKGESEDYIFFELTDMTMTLDAMNRLKQRYPYAMGLEYSNLIREQQKTGELTNHSLESKNILELFEEFYGHYKGTSFDENQQKIVTDLLKESEGV